MHHSTLDVIQVGVVLQSPLQQSSLLTELSNVCTIVVCEHLVAQDSICNLQQNMKQCILHIPQKCNAVVLFYFPIGLRVFLFCFRFSKDVSTCGACMRFISSRRVCRGPSDGLLFLRASRRKEVHCWIRLYSIKTSTI